MRVISTVAIAVVLAMVSAFAAPIPPTDPIDLTGKVVGFVWVDKTHFECGGTRYSFGISAGTDPAHYLIILKTAAADKKRHQDLTSMIRLNRFTGLSHPIMLKDLDDDEVLLEIISPKIESLKAGTMIELLGYSLSGDERGTCSSYRTLKVGGKVITPQKAEKTDRGEGNKPSN